MKKTLALVLCLVTIVSMLSGCQLMELLEQVFYQGPPSSEPEVTEPMDTGWEKHLVYTLDQDMIDSFYACLETAEDLSVNGPDWETVDAAIEELDDAYMELVDQYQIAYVLYCADQSDEGKSQRYLDAMDICTDAELAYNEMARNAYQSDSPYIEQLFEDWTPEEIDMMLKHNDEVAALEKRNSEITVEYRELDPATMERDMIPLYNELVSNNNRMAQIYGYDNYYEFAYKMIYSRDYDGTQLQKMRSYAAQYMPQISTDSLTAFYAALDALDDQDQVLLSDILWTDYDLLDEDYVGNYIADLGESTAAGMRDMFENDRVMFTKSPNAYEGAFTTFIDDEPFCYYGPGYMGNETLIHELGHYYGGKYVDGFSLPMDLCETQSQSNEWLFIRYLRDEVSEELYRAIVEYKLTSESSNIMVFMMVDAFEELVYTHENAGNLTAKEYDDLMVQAAELFGGIDFVTENAGNVQSYWKLVVVESPVYYISYAVSSVAAINLFTVAEKDEAAARECYRILIEEADENEGFLWHIQQAGLSGPFDETVYQNLAERYKN